MKKKQIIQMYRDWRKANGNQKPDRAIVKMYWEDGDNTEKGYQVDTIHLRQCPDDRLPSDDALILFYVSGLSGLFSLMKPDNGSEFVITEVLEFYKSPK